MTAGLEFLVLEASFLAKTYGGAEWPPAPFRLLQAIVAGCRSITAPGLAWLEQQPAPFVLATDEPAALRFKRSIPNNADPRKVVVGLRGSALWCSPSVLGLPFRFPMRVCRRGCLR